jgi:hypothetical protein
MRMGFIKNFILAQFKNKQKERMLLIRSMPKLQIQIVKKCNLFLLGSSRCT